jgi:hypothetical protein
VKLDDINKKRTKRLGTKNNNEILFKRGKEHKYKHEVKFKKKIVFFFKLGWLACCSFFFIKKKHAHDLCLYMRQMYVQAL